MNKIKTIAIILLMFMYSMNNIFAQSKSEKLIHALIVDLQASELSSLELIEKHFAFNSSLSQADKEQDIYPILTRHLDRVREYIAEYCPELNTIKHDESLAMVKSYNLRTGRAEDVYYIICNEEIITPVLINDDKIASIMVYSKTREGSKAFLVY